MSDRIVPMPEVELPLTAPPSEEAQALARKAIAKLRQAPVTRDWKSLPDSPERIAQCAAHLHSQGVPVVTVQRWVEEGERTGITHMAIGAPYSAILTLLETPGALSGVRVPRQKSWTDAEVSA